MKLPSPKDLKRFIKFGVVGASGVGVNHGILLTGEYYVFASFERSTRYGLALSAAILISIFSNFLLNDIWTWRDRRRAGARAFLVRMSKYFLVAGIAGVVQAGVSWTMKIPFELNIHLSNLTGIAAGVLINFFVNHMWTYVDPKKKRPDKASQPENNDGLERTRA